MRDYVDTNSSLPAAFFVSCPRDGNSGVVCTLVLSRCNFVLVPLFIHVQQVGHCTTGHATAVYVCKYNYMEARGGGGGGGGGGAMIVVPLFIHVQQVEHCAPGHATAVCLVNKPLQAAGYVG